MREHERTRDGIEEYLDEALPADEEQRIEAHLAACRTCREDVAAARRLRRLARSAPPVPVPPELGDAILGRLGGAGAAPRIVGGRDRARPIFAFLAVAAAALLIAVAGFLPREAVERAEPIAALSRPASRIPAVTDWIVQAVNAPPEDAAFLIEEARASGLLSAVREELADARGAVRDYLRRAEDLLILLESEPSPKDFLSGAQLVARARP